MWQKITDHCHFCHWWQNPAERRITAMIIFFALLAFLTLLGVIDLARLLGTDRPARPPRSHHADPFEPHRIL